MHIYSNIILLLVRLCVSLLDFYGNKYEYGKF